MSVNHTKWMNFAILEGLRSKGATGRNPPVGCVIVKNNILLSYGRTGSSGRPHAEEVALGLEGVLSGGVVAGGHAAGEHGGGGGRRTLEPRRESEGRGR